MYEHPISNVIFPTNVVEEDYEVLNEDQIDFVATLKRCGNSEATGRVDWIRQLFSESFGVSVNFNPKTGKIVSDTLKENEKFLLNHIQSAVFYMLADGKENWRPEVSPEKKREILAEKARNEKWEKLSKELVSDFEVRSAASWLDTPADKFAGVFKKDQPGLVCRKVDYPVPGKMENITMFICFSG